MNVKDIDSKKRDLYFAYREGKVTIQQFKAQMRDLGFEEWEIELFLDGDSDGPE